MTQKPAAEILSRMPAERRAKIAARAKVLIVEEKTLAKKPDYKIPTTNARGLDLVWTLIYPAELARQLGISRAAAGKWTEVPIARINAVARIVKIPREHILPEVYAPVRGTFRMPNST